MAHYFLLETFLRILMEYLKNINQPICVWKNCLILFLDLFTSAMSTMVQLLRSWSSISTAAEASIASPSFVISLTELRKVSLTSSSLTRIQWRRRWLLTSLSLGADRSRWCRSAQTNLASPRRTGHREQEVIEAEVHLAEAEARVSVHTEDQG